MPFRLAAWSFAFSRTSGVVKVGALMPMKSCVNRSSSRSFGPGTPISLVAMLRTPTSSMSGGLAGPGPANRTQARKVRGSARTPRRHSSGTSSRTMNSPRTMPCVLVFPARWNSPEA